MQPNLKLVDTSNGRQSNYKKARTDLSSSPVTYDTKSVFVGDNTIKSLSSVNSLADSYISFNINKAETLQVKLPKGYGKIYTVIIIWRIMNLQVYHVEIHTSVYDWTVPYRFSEL